MVFIPVRAFQIYLKKVHDLDVGSLDAGWERNMFLLYAYIAKYKNYENQEIVFDHDYQISFTNSELSIRYCGKDPVKEMLRGNGKRIRFICW